MTESGKVARNSDGQLRFVQSAGSSWWCLSSSSPWPSSVYSRGTETRPPLCSAPFCLFDAGSRYIAQMSLELGNPLTSAHRSRAEPGKGSSKGYTFPPGGSLGGTEQQMAEMEDALRNGQLKHGHANGQRQLGHQG